jgi:thymidylate synthase (FAD)
MINVLDHGYVKFIESWGTGDLAETNNDDFECGIIEAARQSTQGSFRGWEQDEKLLGTLYRNKHSTPFEFAGMVIEVQAPIFVFREWHRHRTQSYNEMSARYSPLPDLNYVPSIERVLIDGGSNKQAQAAQGANKLDDVYASFFINRLKASYQECQDDYEKSLSQGVPKELARLLLPVGRYSKMRASANLRNWLSFLSLRLDVMAQWEIRQYAEAVAVIIEQVFPRTYKLFKEKT